MNKPNFSVYAADDKTKNLLATVFDRYNASNTKNILQYTDFLNEAEQSAVIGMLEHEKIRYVRFGGYDNAERAVLFFLPDYMNEDDITADSPLVCLNMSLNPLAVKFSVKGSATHRDYLGALSALGIERKKLGDIIAGPSDGNLITFKSTAEYIEHELISVGRYNVTCRLKSLSEFEYTEPEYFEKSVTVASLRADCLLSAALGISRSEAERLIRSSLVSFSHRIVTDPDKKIDEGCCVSARGYGRFLFDKISGTSKKGRTFVNFRIYK